ncbi:hypothetical protein, variant [Gaeumannomyces tritici R3-111a-1]|uniref:Uncharacterized protein n=1 Tax=Gaeumannomyces tritici (strain R3-111a-1) TaxID=644352 RepID=J3PFF2_GAET3|nr:hypothetical protein, variant [Gaeumannomyces tritici R3-111a-1]EJT70053.1 hypothetical protein, variant [Gaeumannomyces tritici R3-111a-1]
MDPQLGPMGQRQPSLRQQFAPVARRPLRRRRRRVPRPAARARGDDGGSGRRPHGAPAAVGARHARPLSVHDGLPHPAPLRPAPGSLLHLPLRAARLRGGRVQHLRDRVRHPPRLDLLLHPVHPRRGPPHLAPAAGAAANVIRFKLVRPQYIISASHIHRTFRHVRTRGWTGSPVSSLAASTTWSQWSGGPGEDDPYYFDSSRTWRKLVVEPVVKRSTGHVLVHIAQHCWTWNGANNDETPGPFPAIDPDSCWGDKADPDDEFDLWNFLPASPERAFQGPRLPWWANELLEPCVHMLQRDEIGHLRQRLCKKPWGPPRRQVLRAIEAFMAEREREQPPSPPPSSSLPSSSSSSSSSSSLSVFDNWEPGTDGGSPRRAAPTTRARHVRSVCPECPTEVLLTEIVYGADSGDLAEGAEVMLDSWQDFSCRLPADPPGRHGRVPTRCVYRCWPVRHMPPVPVPLQPLDRGSDNDDDEDDDDDEVEGGYDLDSDASSVRSGQHYWSSERKSVFRTRGGIGAAINLITEAPQALLTWRDPEFMADYNDP